MPGFVSTLLNHAYSTPSREVPTFLQVTELWMPPRLPVIDYYHEPFTFDYEHLQSAPQRRGRYIMKVFSNWP